MYANYIRIVILDYFLQVYETQISFLFRLLKETILAEVKKIDILLNYWQCFTNSAHFMKICYSKMPLDVIEFKP